MTAHNRSIVQKVINDLDKFMVGDMDFDGIQASLQSAMSLLEREDDSVERVLRLAEADIEEIRFTMLQAEQRPAAVFRLDELRAELTEQEDLR